MTRIARAALTDWYVEGTESAALVGDQVMVLSELATSVLGALAETPLELEALRDLLVEEYGAPPDADPTAMVRTLVDDLASAGLVELS